MKQGFEGELILKYRDKPIDGKWFEVARDFSYVTKTEARLTVPMGVGTDFASIPRAFRWMIARVGKYGKAAVLHDYLCEYHITTRKRADQIFLEAMKLLGVNWLRRKIMYMGVRVYSIVTLK